MPTVEVHKFGPAFGLPDASPFVMKVETYLRLTGQPYTTVTADVRKAPRAQLPFITVDGVKIPDSTAIVDHLEGLRGQRMDAALTPGERALGYAFKAMLEDQLYFGVLYMRWTTDDGWAVFEPKLREMLGQMGVPGLMRGMVAKSARKQTSGRAARQGLGRAPREEVVKTCNRCLDALSVELADKKWFFGDAPSTVDATVYAFVAGALCPAFDNEVRKFAASKANLVAYEKRVREGYWKDGAA